jgi:hypothetical protein
MIYLYQIQKDIQIVSMSHSPYLTLEKLREKSSEFLQMTDLVIASLLRGKGFTFLDKMYSGPSEPFSFATI